METDLVGAGLLRRQVRPNPHQFRTCFLARQFGGGHPLAVWFLTELAPRGKIKRVGHEKRKPMTSFLRVKVNR